MQSFCVLLRPFGSYFNNERNQCRSVSFTAEIQTDIRIENTLMTKYDLKILQRWRAKSLFNRSCIYAYKAYQNAAKNFSKQFLAFA